MTRACVSKEGSVVVSQNFGTNFAGDLVHNNARIGMGFFVSLDVHAVLSFDVFPKFNRASRSELANVALESARSLRPLVEDGLGVKRLCSCGITIIRLEFSFDFRMKHLCVSLERHAIVIDNNVIGDAVFRMLDLIETNLAFNHIIQM